MYLMYSKKDCVQCTELEGILKRAGEHFEMKKLDVDFTRDDLVNLFKSIGEPLPRSFPVLFQDLNYIGGLKEAKKLFLTNHA